MGGLMTAHDPILCTAILTLIFCLVYVTWNSLKDAAESDEHGNRCPHASGNHEQNGKRYCNACDAEVGE